MHFLHGLARHCRGRLKFQRRAPTNFRPCFQRFDATTRPDDDDDDDDELFARIYVFARVFRNARSMLRSTTRRDRATCKTGVLAPAGEAARNYDNNDRQRDGFIRIHVCFSRKARLGGFLLFSLVDKQVLWPRAEICRVRALRLDPAR